jgi:hypothetical protein
MDSLRNLKMEYPKTSAKDRAALQAIRKLLVK